MSERLGYLHEEPAHILKARLRLAALGYELGKTIREYERAYESVAPLRKRQDELAKRITEATTELDNLLEAEK